MCKLFTGLIRAFLATVCFQLIVQPDSPAQNNQATNFLDSLRYISHEQYFENVYRLHPEMLGKPTPHKFPVLRSPFTFSNVNISNDTFPQNEPSVRISHKDPNRMVAAWRDFRTGVDPAVRRVAYGFSSDGGTTWTPGFLLPNAEYPEYARNSDPSVCVDTSGNFHIATIGLDESNNNWKIIVYTLDGEYNFLYGSTFAPSDTGGPHYDKEYITTDLSPSSPFFGNLYIVFNGNNAIGFTRSTDQGVSWSPEIPISSEQGTGPDPAIGPDGSINVVWNRIDINGWLGVFFNRSTDGGKTFGTEIHVDSQYNQISVSGLGNLPSIASDISNGPHRGNLYTVWSDRRNGDLDVFLSISEDGGGSWSKARRVNDDPIGDGKHQFWPWVAVDDRGVVSIVYYDTRNTPDSTISETYLAYSWDGGLTFTNRLISSAQTPQSMPNGDVRFGDYIGIDSWGGHTVPVWTDERTGGFDMDIYTASLDTLPLVNFSGVNLKFLKGWGLVSMPVVQSHNTASQVFPQRSSSVYAYESGGYDVKDTLKIGTGYWVRLSQDESFLLSGDTLKTDSIAVVAGWNLVGSISESLATTSITSDPPGLVTSQFFGYSNGYFISEAIIPGSGYWVKVDTAGKLILSTNSSQAMRSTSGIRIVATSELPPPPPDGTGSQAKPVLPKQFALDNAYPNPFNPATQLQYALPVDSKVRLIIYNLLGQVVAELQNGVETAGYKSVEWNASAFSSGIYFYRLEATSTSDASKTFTSVKKMVLIK